uniref:WGS project CBMI000000000 data, contig CS3069_c004438 n=1 Tax=Fusarium clavum TaxID=2594811 RepID=A0A090N627_9HYPO|nr:unnamed protein product [Fusarium clavum]
MSSDLLRPWILASFAKSLSSSRLSSEAASSTDFMCSSDASANGSVSEEWYLAVMHEMIAGWLWLLQDLRCRCDSQDGYGDATMQFF